MTADWAVDLGQQGVACVSLYPGLVRTEKMLASPVGPKIAKSNATETPEYTGRAVVALSLHHREMGRGGAVMEAGWSGRTVFGTDVGEAFGFVDTDGHVRPFSHLMSASQAQDLGDASSKQGSAVDVARGERLRMPCHVNVVVLRRCRRTA